MLSVFGNRVPVIVQISPVPTCQVASVFAEAAIAPAVVYYHVVLYWTVREIFMENWSEFLTE